MAKEIRMEQAKKEEELAGLDVTEHGLPSAYADFMPAYKD